MKISRLKSLTLTTIVAVMAFFVMGSGFVASAQPAGPSGSFVAFAPSWATTNQSNTRDWGPPPCACEGTRGPRGWSGKRGPRGKTGKQGPSGQKGNRGTTGATGVQGATGDAGARGATGSAGLQGATGIAGPVGPIGPTGITGPIGLPGADGAAGATGPNGAPGNDGVTGATGSTGSTGATGVTGATGASPVLDYGYIYNTGAQVVAIGSPVTFDTNGVLSGLIHAPGTSQITVVSAGIYEVDFSVSGVEPNQFALFVNGVPDPGAIYGSGAGTQQTTGMAILQLSAGDVIELLNHSSASAVTLQTLAGGSESNVNASILIKSLG